MRLIIDIVGAVALTLGVVLLAVLLMRVSNSSVGDLIGSGLGINGR